MEGAAPRECHLVPADRGLRSFRCLAGIHLSLNYDAFGQMYVVKPNAIRPSAFRLVLGIAELQHMVTRADRALEFAPFHISRQRVAQLAVQPEEELAAALRREHLAVIRKIPALCQIDSQLQHRLCVQRVVVSAAGAISAAMRAFAGDLPQILRAGTLPRKSGKIAGLPVLRNRMRNHLSRQRHRQNG